ncbi:MAG TPA: hypothetical protein VN641_22445 [Urbifossiella sp.]|nr:hypothetical protein [Urbifossiella sp.]
MIPATTVVISDPELLAKLASSDGLIVFRGPDGQTVRFAEPVPQGHLPNGIKSPFTDVEIEEARKRPDSGITLAEFWEKMNRGEWK